MESIVFTLDKLMKLLKFFKHPTYKFNKLLNQFNKRKTTSHIVVLLILKISFAVVDKREKPYGILIVVLFGIIFTSKNNKG
jgi:hypothetical protein